MLFFVVNGIYISVHNLLIAASSADGEAGVEIKSAFRSQKSSLIINKVLQI